MTPRWWKLAVIIAGVAVVYVGAILILTTITAAIWPGEAKLLAPIFCDDARPDAFVVSDTYQSGPGETSTNFTMYCVGPRGDHRDVGWLKPFLATAVLNGVVVTLVIAAFAARPILRRRRTRQTTRAAAAEADVIAAAGRARSTRPTTDRLPPGIISDRDAVPSDDVS